jgi:hypothetical protein
LHVEELHAAFGGVLAVLDEDPAVVAQHEALAGAGDAEDGVVHLGLRIIEDGTDVLALQACGHFEAAELCGGGIEIEQLDERIAHAGLFAGHADDERHARGFVVQADFGPEIVLAEMEAVVAGEDDDGVVRLPGFFERVEHLADLCVHEAHGA